jgi:hypothetical protein
MGLRRIRTLAGFGCVALVALLIAPTSLLAAEKPQWYAAAALESQQISIMHGNDPFSDNYEFGPRGSGYSVRGGLRVLKHLGVEAGIQRIQNVEVTEPLSMSVRGLVGHLELDAQLERIVVVGMWPFARIWEAFLKGGVGSYRLDGQQALTDPAGAPVLTRPVSQRHTDLPIALGVSAAVGPSWHVVLELSSIEVEKSLLGLSGDDSASLGGWAIGAEYRFGHGSSGSDTGR